MSEVAIPVKDRRSMLRNLVEKDLWPLLQSLFIEMDFYWAEITHGTDEQGRDLVACGPTSTGGEELVGVVVKAGNINGGVSAKQTMSTVLRQVSLCMSVAYYGPKCRNMRKINRVIVVTNGSISGPAKKEISGSEIPYGSIETWDNADLERKVTKYYPAYYLNMRQELHDYLVSLRSSCEQMNDLQKHIHFHSARRLSEIFVDVPMVEGFSKPRMRVEGKKTPKKGMSSIFPEIKEPETISTDELLNPSKDLFIEGLPGSGKSCLLRISCIRLVDKLLCGGNHPIPIFLSSKDIIPILDKIEEIDLISLLYCVNDVIYPVILDMMNNSSFILFVDGLDEIHLSTNREKLLNLISGLKNRIHSLRVIVTSRPLHVWQNTTVMNFREATLLPINISSMTSLLEKLIGKPALYVEVLRELTESGILDKLPRTPLVITLIALLHEQESSSEIPSNLYELYNLFCQVHLQRWGKVGSKLYDTKVAILEIIAYYIHNSSTSVVSVADAVVQCTEYLNRRGEGEPLLFITNVIRDNALIKCNSNHISGVNESNDIYSPCVESKCREDCHISFVHQSFQEYFCARYVTKKAELLNDVVSKFEDPWWGALGVFIAGEKKDIDDILIGIVNMGITDEKYAFSKMMNLGYTAQAATLTSHSVLKKACEKGLILIEEVYKYAAKMNDMHNYKLSQHYIVGALVYSYQHTYSSKYLSNVLKEIYKEVRVDFISTNIINNRISYGTKMLALALSLATLGDITYIIDMGGISNQSDGVLNGLIALLVEDMQKQIDTGELKLEDESTRDQWHRTSEAVRKLAIKHRKMLMAAMTEKPNSSIGETT